MAATAKQLPNESYSDIVKRIKPISKPTNGYKALIYGRSGTGKTTLLCTFPKPLLLIGAEDGTNSVYNVEGVDFVRTYGPEDVGKLLFYQRKVKKYATVGLDSASSHQDYILRHLMRESGLLEEDDDLPAQLGYGEVPREIWNEYSSIMKEQLREFLELSELGTNAVVLAQEKVFDADEEASDLITPSVMAGVSPSVAFWLNPQCDYVCQTLVREGVVKKMVKVKVNGKVKEKEKTTKEFQYCLRVGPHPIYATKFRRPREVGGKPVPPLPDVIINPTFAKIDKLATGGA